MLVHLGKSVPYQQFFVGGNKRDELIKNTKRDFSESLRELDDRWKNYLSRHLSEKELQATEKVVLNSYSAISRFIYGPIRPMASIPTVEDIQSKLDVKEALLDYFVQNDGVYIIVLKNKEFRIIYNPINASELKDRIPYIYFHLIQTEAGESSKRM